MLLPPQCWNCQQLFNSQNFHSFEKSGCGPCRVCIMICVWSACSIVILWTQAGKHAHTCTRTQTTCTHTRTHTFTLCNKFVFSLKEAKLRAKCGYTYIIALLGRLKQEDLEFQVSLGYVSRPCLKIYTHRASGLILFVIVVLFLLSLIFEAWSHVFKAGLILTV